MSNTQKLLTFKHGANAGDLIYSLWAVREACKRNDAKAVYMQWMNREAYYYEGAVHPTKHDGKQVSFNSYMFNMIKPLIMSLPFIEDFVQWEQQRVVINLDRIRSINVNMPYGDIRSWYGLAYPDMQCDLSERLIEPSSILENALVKESFISQLDDLDISNSIIVNRTSRYRNPQISYSFINSRQGKVYFVGTYEEYSDFINEVPKAIYLEVENFLHLAACIAVCKAFIGNQSFCFSLAEAMQTTRVLELCAFAPNVHIMGPNGRHFLDQQCFEILVDEVLEG